MWRVFYFCFLVIVIVIAVDVFPYCASLSLRFNTIQQGSCLIIAMFSLAVQSERELRFHLLIHTDGWRFAAFFSLQLFSSGKRSFDECTTQDSSKNGKCNKNKREALNTEWRKSEWKNARKNIHNWLSRSFNDSVGGAMGAKLKKKHTTNKRTRRMNEKCVYTERTKPETMGKNAALRTRQIWNNTKDTHTRWIGKFMRMK